MSISVARTAEAPVNGQSPMDAPLPYTVQALLRAIDEGLNAPEPVFDPEDEWTYVTSTARRMDRMREALRGTIENPSAGNAGRAAAEIAEWLTSHPLQYRSLVHEETETGPGSR